MRLAISILVLALLSGAQEIQAVWQRFPWKDVKGTVTFADGGIHFDGGEKDKSFQVRYIDVQQLDRTGSGKIRILTYKDQWLYGWADKEYSLRLTGGALSEQDWQNLRARLSTPVIDRTSDTSGSVEKEIPVKHLHRLGGCDGILKFTDSAIIFESSIPQDSRRWRYGKEIAGIFSTGPYDLEISVFEHTRSEPGNRRPFRFQLKQALDQTYLGTLKYRLYSLEQADLKLSRSTDAVSK